MVRVSIVLAAHNEGDLLWKTVASCRETCTELDYEIVVSDDASEDDSIVQLKKRFPEVAVYQLPRRHGPSPTKDLGAQQARGDLLVFLDAHCKPESGAIATLVSDVCALDGDAIVTPTVACLNPARWINDATCPGHGYVVDLDSGVCSWIGIDSMRPCGRFYESPSLIGCCFAMSKWLYEKLWGFDANMYMWGVEDVDLGVKSWLFGYPVLHNPEPVIGHRFQEKFTTYVAPNENLIANQLRMAYKVFSPSLWREWLTGCRARHRPDTWYRAWNIFTFHRGTAEIERVYLQQNQKCDIISYARRFGMSWPRSHAVAADIDVASLISS